jgi:hypothetical protein
MGPFVHPAHPQFADPSEELVWNALRAGLREDDVLLYGMRFTDPEEGEVEIDLLVLMPDCGTVVIEVKGGLVSFSGGAFRQSGSAGVHPIAPIEQARKGVYALRRFLERQPSWSRGPVRAGWLVAFPYTAISGDMGPEGRRDLLIGSADVSHVAERVFERLWDPSIQIPMPASGWVDAALHHLMGSPNSPAEVAFRTAARLTHVDQLTQAQSTVLGFVAGHPRFCVTGPAGTGKTWLAMEQARRWAQAGDRVCLVSYGRGVAEAMKRATNSLPAKTRPAFTGTFHQLGVEWGVHAEADDGSVFWEQTAPIQMRLAAEGLPRERRFSAFVVDEAQDFADSWWPALLESASTPEFKLAVFRDDEQAVFHERRGVPDLTLDAFALTENLRNADEIAKAFRPLVHANFTSRSGSGFAVEYVDCPTVDVIEAADTAVANLVEGRGWLPEHVALLTTQHRHPVQVEMADDRAGYWQSLWDDDDVFYSTVSGFKGLERPVVVLAVDGFHPGVEPASVLYAGMSRARDLLIVVGESAQLQPIVGDRVMKRLHG